MKKDKTFIFLEIAKWLFFLVLPLGVFVWKCTTLGEVEGGTKFIISCSGYVALLLIYIVLKKVIMKNYIANLNGKIVNFTTQLETEIDEQKIPLIEQALRRCLLIRDCFTVAPIIIVCGLLLYVIRAIEYGIVTLYSVVGLIAISYALGFVFMLFQSANVKSKNRK